MKRILKRLIAAVTALATGAVTAASAFADGNIGSSVAITGTQNLISDFTSAALVIAPVAGAAFIVYFCIRRSAADEMDQKKWNNRIVTAVVSTVGAVIAVSLINVVIGYYTTA